MKKLLFSIALVAFAAVSCDTVDDSSNDAVSEPMTISISTNGIDVDYAPLSQSRATDAADLMAVQVYEGETPIAKGLVEDWSDLSFEGYSNRSYKVVATMVVDATTTIKKDDDVYALPFGAAVSTNLEASDVAFEGLASSKATLVGGEYTTPIIDRYYGVQSETVTKDDATIAIQMKRVSFGVEVGIDEDVTLKVAGAPDVVLSPYAIQMYSLNDLEAAYSADESNEPYSETMAVEIIRNSTSVFAGNIAFRRNMSATVIEASDSSLSFDFENSKILRVLTFEDSDYKAGLNYIGGNNWSSLIDSKEYDGSMLYSSTDQYTWTDTNNTFLNGVVNEGADWSTYEPDWKFWTGGIVVSNYYLPVVEDTEITYFNQLSLSNGSAGAAGHNGSANFAIVNDGAAGFMGLPPYLTFSDNTARVIDHLYISSTSFFESSALYGNDLTAAIGPDDNFTITAMGYDDIDAGHNNNVSSVTYEFVTNGELAKGWNKWDLKGLGKVVKVRFSISSSVVNTSGISLPTNFAIDDVAVQF